MKKLSKIVLILAIVMGMLFIQTQVQAGGIVMSTSNAAGNSTANTSNGTTNAPVTNNLGNNLTTNRNVNTNRNTNTLPKTGIEDSPAGIIMIIGVISAIYAYKKIRDYNV